MKLYECFKHWLRPNGTIYLYGDPHFGDLESYKIRFPEEFKSTHTYGSHIDVYRPNEWNIEDLDQMQIDNINRICSKNDTLIILGDVGDIECVKKLKAGYKVLILGNHDKGVSNYKRVITQDDDTCPICGDKVFQDYRTLYNCGEDYAYCYHCNSTIKYVDGKINDNHLFDEVYEGPVMINSKIMLSHEPILDVPYIFNIHSHTHNIEDFMNYTLKMFDSDMNTEDIFKNYLTSIKTYELNRCCAIAELTGYKPVLLNEIVESGVLSHIKNIHRYSTDIRLKEKERIENE